MAVSVAFLAAGTPQPVDGLCPTCLRPSMLEVPVSFVSDAGVSPFGTWRGCLHCDVEQDGTDD